MSAGRYNILMEQGATFSLPLVYQDSTGTPVDLTTYTAILQVRENPASPVIVELSTSNGGITLGGVLGTITLFLSAVATSLLPAGEFFYDLKLHPGVAGERLLEGAFTIRAQVTQ